MIESYADWIKVLIDGHIMVVNSKILYLQDNQSDVIDGVLTSIDVMDDIKSDLKWMMAKGPFKYKGQN